MSRRQAIIGHLQLFGKILLKQLNQTYTHIQQQHPHTHSSSTGASSLETTATFPTTATTTTISPYSLSHLRTHESTTDSLRQMATTAVAAVTGVVAVAAAVTTAVKAVAATVARIPLESSDDSEHPQQQKQHQQKDMSTNLPFIFPETPSFIESSRTGLKGSLAKQGGREGQGQDRLPCVSTTMGPRPSILPLTSIHQFISSITSTPLPVSVTNTTDTTATSGTVGTGAGTLVRGQVLNFRGTSHHQGFLILFPDLDEDLILDLTPTLERIYGSPLHPTTSEEDDIDVGLTIVLFEEDEVPKKMWTLTIPRPVGIGFRQFGMHMIDGIGIASGGFRLVLTVEVAMEK
ncbi:MAG: hypothetical protein JOS17DRAFT_832364 [Linnemannia elongata]|nr:MAG: hypothetical protein JOS17DRAFT_832364 [Linnemannia elongata]